MFVRTLKLAALAMVGAAAMVPAAADAQYYGRGYDAPPRGYYDRGYSDHAYFDGGYDRPRGYRDDRRRDRRASRNGRYRCDRGTGGTIIGAIAGGLLGNTIAGRGDRGVGTVIGAGAGALAGRAIDRDC